MTRPRPDRRVDATYDVDTPSGPARVHPVASGSAGLVVLGHGAGGGVDTPDLRAVAGRLADLDWSVALVEQPYRVKGRRAPEAAPRLDAAWHAVVEQLRREHRRGGGSRPSGRLVVGGRSSGARVACRTAAACGADGVIALAFPLHPPTKPEKSRLPELTGVGVPVLVVQGERDPFGAPGEFPPGAHVVAVPGDHSLRTSAGRAAEVVAEWIAVQGR